jgi:predicted dehydrogenase
MTSDLHHDPLRVAVIGTGFGARVQLPGFLAHPQTNVVALCGRSDEKTKDIAARHGVKAVYTDYEQMLVDVRPDIVSITTPPRWHNPMTVAALQVDAHVLCEKPLALNTAEVEEMLDEAEHRRRVHVVDHEFRYLPARYYQKVLVDQNYIGEPVLLEATFMSTSRWDPARAWNWWSSAEQGGGVTGAIGSHYIDAFRWLTGREVLAVTAALHTSPPFSARPDPGGGTRAVTTDDTATLVLELDGGLRGVINLCVVAAGETQRLAIHGTDGALVVEDDLRLWGRRRDEALTLVEIPSEYEPPLWVPDENLLLGPFVKLIGLMADAIHGQALIPPPTFFDGLAVQSVLDAAYQSSAEGRRIEMNW